MILYSIVNLNRKETDLMNGFTLVEWLVTNTEGSWELKQKIEDYGTVIYKDYLITKHER